MGNIDTLPINRAFYLDFNVLIFNIIDILNGNMRAYLLYWDRGFESF